MSLESKNLSAELARKAAVSNRVWPMFESAIDSGDIARARILRGEVECAYEDMIAALKALAESVVHDADLAIGALEMEKRNG